MTNHLSEWNKIKNKENHAKAKAHPAFVHVPATESEISQAWNTFKAMIQDKSHPVLDYRNRVSMGKLAPNQRPSVTFDCTTCGSRYSP